MFVQKVTNKVECMSNQSVENAGVAFVRGANERNKSVMYDEQVWANKPKD